jgi:serine/threonine-protein kinase
VLLKALEKDRDKRYSSASELLKALDKALPPNARGSDEQVGAFVLSLFGEQRRQSHAALADALERADQHQLSSHGSGRFSSRPPNGGASGVSALSTVGVAASLAPPKLPDDLELEFARSNRRFTKWTIGLGLGVAALLGAVLLWLGNSEPSPTPPPKPAAPAAVTLAPVSPPPAPAPAPSATPTESAATSATPSIASPTLGADPPKVWPRSTAAAPTTVAPPAGASSAPPPKRSWKQDPGF